MVDELLRDQAIQRPTDRSIRPNACGVILWRRAERSSQA